jgi:hypothetical protein
VRSSAPTVVELAERVRAVVGAELERIERAAASAPLSEVETRRLRELASALHQAAVAAPARKGRVGWQPWTSPSPPDATAQTSACKENEDE